MDIASFVNSGGKFDLIELFEAFSLLVKQQRSFGSVTGDFLCNISLSKLLNAREVFVHLALVVESCVIPFLQSISSLKLKLKPSIFDESTFYRAIISVLLEKALGAYCPAIEALDRDYKSHLKLKLHHTRKNSIDTATMPQSSNPLHVLFMARARRLGMDILFPPITHDMVLAAIFVSIQTFPHSAAHREIIDLVMAVKVNNAHTQIFV